MQDVAPMGNTQPLGLTMGLIVMMVVLLLRNRRPRKLRIEWLWFRPAVFVAIMAAALVIAPPPMTVSAFALLVAGLALGGALGWQRGRFMHIEVEPTTHALTTRTSPVGVIFIIALVAMRNVLASLMRENAETLHLSAPAVIDALVVLAGATMATQGLEMWLRARRLLAQARATKADAMVV